MSYCAWKTGSSSKHSFISDMTLSLRQFCNSNVCKYISFAVFGLYCLGAYYLYLDNLYIVDEVLDVGGPREFTLSEQLSIRVIAPRKFKDLDTFILTYSVCPIVKDIQVIWNQPTPHPLASSFKYQHTHSLVTFGTNPAQFETKTESKIS